VKQFTLNTGVIPVGVTVNLGFAISNLFELFQPGNGNNTGTEITITKNAVPISITAGSVSNNTANRPLCSPSQIQSQLSGSSASTSVISTDILVVTLASQVKITSDVRGNCNTRLDNTLGVVGSISYSGLGNCTVINTGNMNMTNQVTTN
jgi:hypothetical protein